MTTTKVQTELIAADAITGAHIADDAIDSEHYTNASIDNAHLADDAVDSAELAAGSVDLAHMSVNSIDSDQYIDGSIDLAHMSADSIDSTQYVDGSIDTAHLAADVVTAAKLADDAVVTANIVDLNVTTAKIANNAITAAKLPDNVITATMIPNATNLTLGTVTAALTGNVTGTSSLATVSDSTANTNFPIVFHNESNALLDDTGALRYNPSTGELLAPKLTVAGTTTTVDTVTMQAANAIIFEGATADNYETTLSIVDPTADHTQYLINQGGYIPLLAAATTTAISSTPAELNLLDGLDRGSILYGNASSATTVLGQGSANQVLTSDGTDIAWQDASSFDADAAQIFNESGADVDFRIESNDSAYMFYVDAGNNKVLVKATNTASVTNSATALAARAFEVDGNSGEGSDSLSIFAMADGTGNYGIEVSNSGHTAQYDLLLNPIMGGNVGIGTINPIAPLYIRHATASKIIIHSNSDSAGIESSLFFKSVATNQAANAERAKGAIIFEGDGTGTGPGKLHFCMDSASDTGNVVIGEAKMTLLNTGKVGIGVTDPDCILEVGGTDAMSVPSGTTAQRPTARNGMIRYNTTTDTMEMYVDGSWKVIGFAAIGTEGNPATAASELYAAGKSDGAYYITYGDTTFQTYYIGSVFNEGWLLAAVFTNAVGDTDEWFDGDTALSGSATGTNWWTASDSSNLNLSSMQALTKDNQRGYLFHKASQKMMFRQDYADTVGYRSFTLNATNSLYTWFTSISDHDTYTNRASATATAGSGVTTDGETMLRTGTIDFNFSLEGVPGDGARVCTSGAIVSPAVEASGGLGARVDGGRAYDWKGNVVSDRTTRSYSSEGSITNHSIWVFVQ